MLADGEIDTPLDEAEIVRLGRRLEELGVEAAAILFLNCYARPDHEARAKAILERNHPALFVSASHELSEEYREFERCSTVVANAYVGPIVRRYIGEIDQRIRREGFAGSFLVVQSNGGLYQAEEAKRHCVHMLESGPAAGVIATQAVVPCARSQERNRVRHGRDHRQGRRHPRWSRAHHRRRLDRRL